MQTKEDSRQHVYENFNNAVQKMSIQLEITRQADEDVASKKRRNRKVSPDLDKLNHAGSHILIEGRKNSSVSTLPRDVILNDVLDPVPINTTPSSALARINPFDLSKQPSIKPFVHETNLNVSDKDLDTILKGNCWSDVNYSVQNDTMP